MDIGAVEVAVGAVVDGERRVLVARRAADSHQGGKWEFPGGKREADEPIEDALERELREELGIEIKSRTPLISLRYAYPDKTVVLHTWRVESFDGEPQGREGQPVEWRPIDSLVPSDFPAANLGILRALQLPGRCLVTPDSSGDTGPFLKQLDRALGAGVRLVILRNHQLDLSEYRTLADRVTSLCRVYGARCMLNMPPEWLSEVECTGLHLTAACLRKWSNGIGGFDGWLSAACHNTEELEHAHRLGVDFVLASPVKATPTHPGAEPLGWSGFAELASRARVPVFALGGVGPPDLQQARQWGGQGVAGIRAFWSD